MSRLAVFSAAFLATASATELWSAEKVAAAGYAPHVTTPLPSTYVAKSDLPTDFTWANVKGTSYVTKSLNQHIPQYCGSCWAHGAASALADRVKIARKAQGVEIDLSIQHILNCGNAGSCYGGDPGMVYSWIKNSNVGVALDTCQPYLACSSDSSEGFCGNVDTTCKAENVCRTCSTFTSSGGFCTALDKFPNVTVGQHGQALGPDAMQKEIYARGSIACYVDAAPLDQYKGGVTNAQGGQTNHIISVVGWGVEAGEPYWHVRNSWGEFWGEMGYAKVGRGNDAISMESTPCVWAVPETWTEHNFPCGEDGTGCTEAEKNGHYVDPSTHGIPLGKKYTM